MDIVTPVVQEDATRPQPDAALPDVSMNPDLSQDAPALPDAPFLTPDARTPDALFRSDTVRWSSDGPVEVPIRPDALTLPVDVAPAVLLVASPTSLDFGTVMVGTVSPSATITVANNGRAVSGPISWEKTGAGAQGFSLGWSTCTLSLVPGATCIISLTFLPSQSGRQNASVSISDGTSVAVVPVTGLAVAPAKLTSSTSSLTFASVAPGSSSAVQAFSITNTGQMDSGPLIVVSSSADFIIQSGMSTDCMTGISSLPVGASCLVRIVFSSRSGGGSTGTVTFSGNPGGTANVSLTGTP
jgi:hypothetical protein